MRSYEPMFVPFVIVLAVGVVLTVFASSAAADDGTSASLGSLLVSDFEEDDLQDWQIVEGRLVKFVSDRSSKHHTGRPFNNRGDCFLTTLDDVKPTRTAMNGAPGCRRSRHIAVRQLIQGQRSTTRECDNHIEQLLALAEEQLVDALDKARVLGSGLRTGHPRQPRCRPNYTAPGQE